MHDLICGKLLGDGCLTKQQGRKPRFQFTHCMKDIGWSTFCFEQLAAFLPLNSPKYKRVNDSRIASGFTESYIVQSRTSEKLCQLYEIWYPHSKKELPFKYIQEHFTDRSLAWWYQDDGHFKHKNGVPKKVILSTDNFSLSENQFLIDFLEKKYGLSFSLDGQNRLLLYSQTQIVYFLQLVNPYIHESMCRKTRVHCEPRKIADRTTVYLPSNIFLSKPTSEINEQYKKLPLLVALTKDLKIILNRDVLAQVQTIELKPYQIKINRESKSILEQLKYQTGMNISQLTAYCFRL